MPDAAPSPGRHRSGPAGPPYPRSTKEDTIPKTKKKRVLSDEHKAALLAGRQAKRDAARQSRAQRVADYKAWNRRDAQRWAAFKAEDITREEWRRQMAADPMPETPSDDDFKYEDGRLTETEAA